jgi:hypothetical protein
MLTEVQKRAIQESLFNKWRLANLVDKTPSSEILEVYDLLLSEVVRHSERLFDEKLTPEGVILKLREAAAKLPAVPTTTKDPTPVATMRRAHTKILASFLDRRTRPADRERSLRNYLSKAINLSDIFSFTIVNSQSDVMITVTEMDASVKRPSHILRQAKSLPERQTVLFNNAVWLKGDSFMIILSQTKLPDAQVVELKAGVERILFDSRVIDLIKSSEDVKKF